MINRCENHRALRLTSSNQRPRAQTGKSFQQKQSPIKIRHSHMTKKNPFGYLAERSARQIGDENGKSWCCFGCDFSHLFWEAAATLCILTTNVSQAWKKGLAYEGYVCTCILLTSAWCKPCAFKNSTNHSKIKSLPTLSSKTSRLRNAERQQFRLNSFQGCCGKLVPG